MLITLRRQLGFTLIELVMVIVIVGIISVFAVGRLDFTSTFVRRGVYDKVKAGLEYARKAAVAKRRYVCVDVAGGTVSFTIDTAVPEATIGHCPGFTNLALPAPDTDCHGANNAICSHADAAIGLVSGGTPFAFNPQGSASATVVLSVTGESNITVEGASGYVH